MRANKSNKTFEMQTNKHHSKISAVLPCYLRTLDFSNQVIDKYTENIMNFQKKNANFELHPESSAA